MQINRIDDKVFRVTITEEEALMVGDITQVDFERSRQIANRIGSRLLSYIMCCSELPDSHQQPVEVEL
ncbi:hypothetical protein ES703_121237 [subsurface metagenome]